jgi:hypothetical protein
MRTDPAYRATSPNPLYFLSDEPESIYNGLKSGQVRDFHDCNYKLLELIKAIIPDFLEETSNKYSMHDIWKSRSDKMIRANEQNVSSAVYEAIKAGREILCGINLWLFGAVARSISREIELSSGNSNNFRCFNDHGIGEENARHYFCASWSILDLYCWQIPLLHFEQIKTSREIARVLWTFYACEIILKDVKKLEENENINLRIAEKKFENDASKFLFKLTSYGRLLGLFDHRYL